MLAFAFAAVVVASTGGCGPDPSEEHEQEPDESWIDTAARGLIDCSERQDTGYTSGSSFAITVVTVDGKPVEVDTANAYWVMQQAAAADGVSIAIVSGFRTMAQQQYLYDCYINCNCNSCNLAARPGYSNHQSGHALDLNTSSGGVLNWLNAHGAQYGFMRTVPSEPWHWEWWGGGPGGGPCGQCTPHCEGSQIIGQDCGRGDCAAFGARCVDDAAGVRCASVFCPDRGAADVCVNDTLIGHCEDGAISTGDCGQFAAFCSTAGGGPAHCASVFCVAGPGSTPVAHDTCLPDGQRYRCDDRGGIEAAPCPTGQACKPDPGSGFARCEIPVDPAPPVIGVPAGGGDEPVSDPKPQDTPGSDPVRPAPATGLRAVGERGVEGGCSCNTSRSESGGGLAALIVLALIVRRRPGISSRTSSR